MAQKSVLTSFQVRAAPESWSKYKTLVQEYTTGEDFCKSPVKNRFRMNFYFSRCI